MLESAVVKFVGHVGNTCDDYRIYVGVKLDEPGKLSSQSYLKSFAFHSQALLSLINNNTFSSQLGTPMEFLKVNVISAATHNTASF